MKLISTAAVALPLLVVVHAKNYGPTKEEPQCDAKDGTCSDVDGKNASSGGSSSNSRGKKKGPSQVSPAKFQVKAKHRSAVHTAANADSGDDSDDDDDSDDEDDDGTLPHGACGLYLAPSSLPHAGLGLFSGTKIPYDHSVNEYVSGTFPGYDDSSHPPLWTDLFVPIADNYKALPYRGQQRFPSWLAYIWPEYPGAMSDLVDSGPFPVVPPEMWDVDDGLDRADGLEFFMDDLSDALAEALPNFRPDQRVSAFAPGLASLANHVNGDLANVDRIYANSRADYNGQEAPWHAGAGAFTPHHRIEFIATKPVKEGMELLIDYGFDWNERNDHFLDMLYTLEKKREAEHKKAKASGDEKEDVSGDAHVKQGFVEGIDRKWDLIDRRELDTCPDELPTEKAKRDRLSEGMAADSSEFHDGEKPYLEYRRNDYHPWVDEPEFKAIEDENYPNSPDALTKPLEWLDQNGVCLSAGKVRVGPSPIQYAGRAAFATTRVGKGEVLLTSPLIAMRREDFVIYKSDDTQEFVRNVLDKEVVVGTELLYNYAFGHPDSPLYLVPTAPIANFINNGGRMTDEKPRSKGANVRVRWPEAGSNPAKLFQWAYNQKRKSHYDNDFDKTEFNDPNPWLRDHPIDVMDRSGRLAWEYVALRDIHHGEEILLDYGEDWSQAWREFVEMNPYARSGYFRHSIGVPEGLFPSNWLGVGDRYEIAQIRDLENEPLEPGVVQPMTWAHNGRPVSSKYAYVVGLEKGFSKRFLEYSEEKGVIELYRKLLTEQEGYHLPSDGFDVYNPGKLAKNETSEADKAMEFFAHRYHSKTWNFNMHFVAAWDESARKSVLKALGDAGFDLAIKGIGERFGYDNMTCFHASYMGVTHCDKSKMHSDIYATNDKSWNIVFPLITVEGTDPELDIMAEDMNTVIGVHYLKDVAYAIGDFGYHQTRPIAYYDPDDDSVDYGDMAANGVPIRVVFGAYCAQIDETNVAMIRHIYDGDDPAPFADQFVDVPMREIHWDRVTGTPTLAKPGGKGV